MNKKIIFLLSLVLYIISFIVTQNLTLSLIAIPVSIGIATVIFESKKKRPYFSWLFLIVAIVVMNGIYMISIANRFAWFIADPSLFRTLKIFSISLLFDFFFIFQIFILKKVRLSQ